MEIRIRISDLIGFQSGFFGDGEWHANPFANREPRFYERQSFNFTSKVDVGKNGVSLDSQGYSEQPFDNGH